MRWSKLYLCVCVCVCVCIGYKLYTTKLSKFKQEAAERAEKDTSEINGEEREGERNIHQSVH